MGLDCLVTIKGSGVRGANNATRSSIDQTLTVEEHLDTHYSGVYNDIFKHVLNCPKCDPGEVVRIYVKSRAVKYKFFGQTSVGLVQLAFKYDKKFPGRVRPSDLQEMVWRLGRVESLVHYDWFLEPESVVRGMKMALEQWARSKSQHVVQTLGSLQSRYKAKFRYSEIYLLFAKSFEENIPIPEEEELIKLASVNYVMSN